MELDGSSTFLSGTVCDSQTVKKGITYLCTFGNVGIKNELIRFWRPKVSVTVIPCLLLMDKILLKSH